MAILDNFKMQMSGVLHPNRFKMVVFFPESIINGANLSEACEFFIRAAQLPGRSVGVIDLPFRGNPFSIAGDMAQPEDVTITVLNDGNLTIRKAVERWMEFMASHITGTKASDLTYMGTAEIRQLDGADNTVKTYELVQLFPTSLGSIALSHDEGNSVETFDITFRYSLQITDLV